MIPRRMIISLDPSEMIAIYSMHLLAEVAELADAHDSKSCTVRYVGSIPTFGTRIITKRAAPPPFNPTILSAANNLKPLTMSF